MSRYKDWPKNPRRAYPFLPFRKRMRSDSNPNRPYLFFRAL